VNNRK